MFTDFRIKMIHFFRKNKKIIFIAVSVWVIIFLINSFLKSYEPKKELQTTYEPHTSVMDDGKSVAKSISNPIEEMIAEYVGYCNESNWTEAYNMLSETCKEYSFENELSNFINYIYTKMPTKKNYAIQDYSNEGNTYIYQIKYTDDMLATGLTNTTYQYTEEKMIFKKQKDGTIEMSVGNFIDYEEIKNISENEYLKVDVKSVVKYYSMEQYRVRFTNRTDNIIVIANNTEKNEVTLQMQSSDKRNRNNLSKHIVLKPKESQTIDLKFSKFYDSNDISSSLLFNSIRVMEQYSGTENISDEVIQSEAQNAIAKFSVTIPIKAE